MGKKKVKRNGKVRESINEEANSSPNELFPGPFGEFVTEFTYTASERIELGFSRLQDFIAKGQRILEELIGDLPYDVVGQ